MHDRPLLCPRPPPSAAFALGVDRAWRPALPSYIPYATDCDTGQSDQQEAAGPGGIPPPVPKSHSLSPRERSPSAGICCSPHYSAKQHVVYLMIGSSDASCTFTSRLIRLSTW